MKNLFSKEWDFTQNAKFYEYRPNYTEQSLDVLAFWAKDANSVADIGAGTGNLSLMLSQRNFDVTAIEPNDAMREIGVKRLPNITWIRAGAGDTTLADKSVDWVTFGSSFGVIDRNDMLKEAHRILKKGGKLSILFNHRALNNPIQKIAQDVIKSFVPDYNGGVRREEQRVVLEENKKLFDNLFYLEHDFNFHQTIDAYLLAWQSVRNTYWDLNTDEGRKLFEKICEKLRTELPKEFDIPYTTKAWNVDKVN